VLELTAMSREGTDTIAVHRLEIEAFSLEKKNLNGKHFSATVTALI